ncbi:MAG: hypothetical protein PVJ28_11435, partial [Acidimicrobiia bacterium]
NVETLTRNGLAQSAAQAAAGQASTAVTLTPTQELALISARTGVEPSTQAGTGWTLVDELNAIQGRTGVEQVAPSAELGFSYDELAAFHARNGVTQQTQSPAVTQPETYTWTLEDELNAIQGRTGVEQGGPYTEPLSGPR